MGGRNRAKQPAGMLRNDRPEWCEIPKKGGGEIFQSVWREKSAAETRGVN